MLTTLYITGNGFELHHGLKTEYQSFIAHLRIHDRELHDLLHNCFYTIEGKELWMDFENDLSHLDIEGVLDDRIGYLPNTSDPDFRDRDWHSFEVEIGLFLAKLIPGLIEALREFILRIHFDSLDNNRLLKLKKESIFLNFNYTNTLETYYAIPAEKILYIHGKANDPKSNLILGHGEDPSDLKEEFQTDEIKPPENLTTEEFNAWQDNMSDNHNQFYEQGKDSLLDYFLRSSKPTEQRMSEENSFFDSLENIKEVFVLGHSLATVDLPYFKKIIESINNKAIFWTVTYFQDEDRDTHFRQLTSIGVQEKSIRFVKMNALPKDNDC